jgi:hypothetical protein
MDRTEFEPYAKAIAEMESRKGSTTAVKSRDGVAQDAINAAQIFDELIEVELKKAQFALQTAHYRSRVDIPLRGPSPQSRVATLYGAWGDNVSTMLQFIYAPENLGVISAAIFRFSKGLREKPSNWSEDVLLPILSIDLDRIRDLIRTYIDALGEIS